MKTHSRYLPVLVLLLLLLGASAHAATLWTIGQKDSSYAEFAVAGKYLEYKAQFSKDVDFVVGKSKADKDWPFIQPGPSDVWADGRTHPFRIEFDLGRAPKAACRLIISTVCAKSGASPVLEVNVNDTVRRTLSFQPGPGDKALADPKAGRPGMQAFLFPADALHRGRNCITLTITANSWLLYDAISLGTTDVKGAELGTVAAAATPFFKHVDGALKQAVRVTVDNTGLEGEAEIALADMKDSAQQVKLAQGMNAFTFLVPPFTQATPCKAVVTSGKQKSEAEFEGCPERQWKIFVAPSAHTDIGYTDLQEKIFERHNGNTDNVLKACDSTPDFKWNLEVFAQADWYRKNADAFKTLEQRIVEGRIGLTSMYLNMLTGLCTGEEMADVLAPAQQFGRAHNVPVVTATITDVPTTVGTLPMFLKQAGVKYFAEGVNQDRGPTFLHADKRMVQSPFWWEGMDGSRVLAILTHSYGQAQVIGLRDSVAVLEQKLPGWIKTIDRPDYPCDAIYGNGAFWDNELVTPHFIEVAAEWNKTWAFPQIIITRTNDYFEYVEKHFADALPVFRGDLGSYWEDGAASSAMETGQVRIAKAALNAASKWCALASAADPKAEYPRAAFAKAWEDAIYYDEHTWGAAGSIAAPKSEQTVKQWEYKAAYATRAREEAAALYEPDADSKSDSVSKKGEFVTVSNACSWARDIRVVIPEPGAHLVAKNAVDGREVPSWNMAGKVLVFTAEQVPALGYRRYKLVPRKPAPIVPFLTKGADGYTWETPSFRYKIDAKTGAFVSIEDLKTHREWVDTASGYGINQFLYVKGGDGTSLIHPGAPAAPALKPLTHTEATVDILPCEGGIAPCLCIVRKGANLPTVTTACWFYPDGHVEFENNVEKEETFEKEAGYFAFPFKLNTPDNTRSFIDLPYGVVEVDKEQPPGADREWYAANSFGAVTDNTVSAYVATREGPMFTVGTMNRGMWPGKVDNNRGTIFAYVFNNYWHTNYKAGQGGSIPFSFALKFAERGFDPVEGTQFGYAYLDWNVRTSRVQGRHAEESFVKLGAGPVILAELKQDAGGNLLARLYNPSYEMATASVAFPKLHVKSASKTDLFGQNGEAVEVSKNSVAVPVAARSIATLVLTTQPR